MRMESKFQQIFSPSGGLFDGDFFHGKKVNKSEELGRMSSPIYTTHNPKRQLVTAQFNKNFGAVRSGEV